MLFSFFNRLDAHSWEITRWEWIVCVLSNSERDDDDDHLFPSLVSRFSASIILFLLLFAQKVFSPRDWLLNPRPHPPLIRWLSLCYLSISISRLAFFFLFFLLFFWPAASTAHNCNQLAQLRETRRTAGPGHTHNRGRPHIKPLDFI